MQHYYPTVQHRAGVVSVFMTHDWHSPYLRREQDTPGRGSRTARSSWLVSPLTAHQCHCVWSLVLGWQLLYCNCGLTTALLPASGHRSASTQSPHRTSGTRPQPRHTRGLLSLLLVSGKRLELSRGPDVPGCQGWMVQGELSPRWPVVQQTAEYSLVPARPCCSLRWPLQWSWSDNNNITSPHPDICTGSLLTTAWHLLYAVIW